METIQLQMVLPIGNAERAEVEIDVLLQFLFTKVLNS